MNFSCILSILFLLQFLKVAADVDTYPVPSVNLENAFSIKYYKLISGQQPTYSSQNSWMGGSGGKTEISVEVPSDGLHGLHMIETSENELVAGGVMGITNDTKHDNKNDNYGDGFVIKTDAAGNVKWL